MLQVIMLHCRTAVHGHESFATSVFLSSTYPKEIVKNRTDVTFLRFYIKLKLHSYTYTYAFLIPDVTVTCIIGQRPRCLCNVHQRFCYRDFEGVSDSLSI